MGCGPSRSAEALTPSADASSRTVTTPAAAAPTAKSPPPAAAAAACCYKPDSEAARLQSLLDCHQLDTPAERRFDAITSLLKDLLEVPVAVVGLIDDDRLYLKSTAGDAQPGASHDRLHSFCDASLRAPNPRMMVVPDTLEDARFKHNEFTKAGIRSYTGAPLVTSEGFVVGSLGVMDIKPRAFPPSALNILCNFAELVVRELERDKALERQRQAELAAVHAKTVRSLTCFNDAVCFCDASAEGWPIRWANEKWEVLTGRHDSDGCSQGSAQLWDILAGLHPEVKRQARQAAIFNQTVSITAPALKAGGRELALELRPASRDHLSLLAPTIAVPNFVEGLDPAEQPALDRLYFIVARPVAAVSPFKPPSAAPTQPAIASSPFKPPLALPQIAVAPSTFKLPPELAASGAAAGGSAGHTLPEGVPASPQSLLRDHPARGMLGSASSAGGSSMASSTGSSVRTLSRFGLQPPAALASIQLGPKLGR